MKFWLSLAGMSFLSATFSGFSTRRHSLASIKAQAPLHEHGHHWVSRCECGCGCTSEECDFFDSDVL